MHFEGVHNITVALNNSLQVPMKELEKRAKFCFNKRL